MNDTEWGIKLSSDYCPYYEPLEEWECGLAENDCTYNHCPIAINNTEEEEEEEEKKEEKETSWFDLHQNEYLCED